MFLSVFDLFVSAWFEIMAWETCSEMLEMIKTVSFKYFFVSSSAGTRLRSFSRADISEPLLYK